MIKNDEQVKVSPNERNHAIDSLRGVAALAVLGFHAWGVLWVGLSNRFRESSFDWYNPDTLLIVVCFPFRWGWWGVPLFFVLSGYCIHRPDARKTRQDFKYHPHWIQYGLRRAWRIYPVFLAALLLTALFDCFTRFITPTCANLGDNSIWCLVMNLATLQGIACPSYGSNGSLWTLGIEIQFYLIYPLLFLLLKKSGMLVSLLFVFGANLLSILTLEAGRYHIDFFLSFWFSWTIGAYIAEVEVGLEAIRLRLLWGLSLLCLGTMFFSHLWINHLTNAWSVQYLLLSFPFALLVWYAIQRPTNVVWNNSLSRLFAFFGLFSYSLYATHYPVLILYRSLIQGGNKSTMFISILPAMLSAVLVGYVVFQLVERWFLKFPGSQSWASKNRRAAGTSPLILTLPCAESGGVSPPVAGER